MKATPASKIIPALAALVLLLCATNVHANGSPFTATTSGNWAAGATWGNSGNTAGVTYPNAQTDAAIIPVGITVTIASSPASCGDLTVNGILQTSINGTSITNWGNITNNGTYSFGSSGQSVINNYGGTNKVITGTGVVSNQTALFLSGASYTILPGTVFLTGGNNTGSSQLTGSGSLTNQGSIVYKTANAPAITGTLNCSYIGSSFTWTNNNSSPQAPPAIAYGTLIMGNTGSGQPGLNAAGLTISSNFTLVGGGNGVVSWPLNNTIGGTLGWLDSSANTTLPSPFWIGGLNQTLGTLTVANSGTLWVTNGNWIRSGGTFKTGTGGTVRFTGVSVIGGTTTTIFTNLFADTGSVVTLTNASTIAATGTLTITNGGAFNAVFDVTGAGALTLRAGGTLGVADASGISSTAATGAIQTTGTRTYESGASYAYLGTAAQVTGNQLPTTGTDISILTISNSAGVTMTSNSSVTNNLVVSAGTLNLAGTTMTLGASAFVFNSGIINGSLTVGATGAYYAGTDGGFATGSIATNLTMSTGATLNLDLGATAAGANDLVVVSNTLTLNSTVINLKAPAGGGAIDQVNDYTLVQAGSISGTPTLNWVTAPANSGNYTLVNTGTSISLHYGAAVAVGSITFTQQPASVGAGQTNTTVQIQVLDGGSSPLQNVTVILSVSNNAATFNGSGTLSQISDVNGNAAFNNLTINTLGTYNLQAVAGTPPSTNYSAAFTISAGAPAKLAIQTAPSTTATAGMSFATQPVITVVDAFGNATTSNAPVTVTASSGTVQGTTTVTASSGTATFSGLSLTNAGNITLTFAATGLTSTNATVAVSAATASQLVFTNLPSTTAGAGIAFASQPVLAVEDAFGNVVNTNSSVDVNASVGGVSGTHPVTAVAGVATFSGLNLTNINNGNPVTLNFTSTGVTGTNSTITVGGGTVAALAWTTQPGAAVYGQVFGQQPVLQTVDQYGNPTTNGLKSTQTVTITHPVGGGTLLGTTTYNIGTSGSNGVITFTDLQINSAYTNNQLSASIGSGVSPTNFAGLQLWLDASDPTTTTLTGTTVTTWIDKSGAAHNATGVTSPSIATNATLAATGASPGRVVRFNGDYMTVSGNLSFLAGVPYTIIALEVANNNGGTASYYIGTDPTGTDRALQVGYRNSGDFTLAQYGDDFDYTTTFTYPQARVWTTRANDVSGGGRAIYLNGTSVATSGNTAALGAPTAGYIGASFGHGENYNGDLAEIMVYTNSLSDTTRTNLENYLLTKWTTGLLPGATTAVFVVSNAPVTITNGLTVLSKFYDGTTTATLTTNSTLVLSGVLPADISGVTLITNGYVANFASSNIGTWPVTVSGLTLGGNLATNYSLSQPTNLTGAISAAPTYTAFSITGNGAPHAGVADSLTITALNSDGTTSTNFSSPGISLTFSGLSAGLDGSAATVNGNPISSAVTVGFTNGVGTAMLVAHKAESSVTLNVVDSLGNSSANSPGSGLPLNVSPGTDSAYRLSAVTTTPVVGVSNQLTLAIVDQYQNPSTFSGGKNITFSGLGNSPGGAQPTVNGTPFGTPTSITFSSTATAQLIATKVQSSALLLATDGTLATTNVGGASVSLSTTAGPATSLGISTQPSSAAAAGVVFAQQPVVTVLDQYGNSTPSNALVLATASAGNLQGTTTVTANGTGTATFSGLSLTNIGNLTLTFSSTGLTSTNSSAIAVSAGTIANLAWLAQPGVAISGAVFGQQPVLATVDQFGNATTNGLLANTLVTVTVTGGGGTLSGTTSTNIGTAGANGRVTFTDLSITGAGTNYQLVASSSAVGSPVAGMAVWLDANNSASVTVSGGQVTAWNDISGNNNNFTTALTNGGAIYYTNNNTAFSGRKSVTFAGNYLGNTTFNNGGVSTLSVFVVFRKTLNDTSGGTFQRPFSTWAGTAGRADYQSTGSFNYDISSTDNGIRVARNETDCGASADLVGVAGVNLSSAYRDAEFLANSSSNALWVNGVLGQSDANCLGNFTIAATAIGGGLSGAGGYNSGLFGDVGELLIYDTALSATDRQTVETYLNKKWLSGNSPNLTATTAVFAVAANSSTASMVTSSENPSGFGDNVTFTNTVLAGGTATGNVIFKVDGTAQGTNALNGSNIATFTTSSLTRATHTITAEYAGDVNFNGVTNSLPGGQVVTNHPPTAQSLTFNHGAGTSLKIAISTLLLNATDPDGDPVVFDRTSATTTNGAPLTVSGGLIIVPASSVNDAFSYTVDDGQGGTNSAIITLTVTGTSGQVTTVSPSSSNAVAQFFGIPGESYTVQRATNVTFNAGISNFPPITAPSNGAFGVSDNFSDLGGVPGAAFYRLLVP